MATSDRTRFTAWVTKYALTCGIKQMEVEDWHDARPGMVLNTKTITTYHVPDWHRTEAEAKARAEEMRAAKIASLRKQIAKLEAMEF